ncbi:hypothetical protein Daqu01_00963 [Deinococcus aquaticus]
MRRPTAPLALTATLLLPLALSSCAFGAYFPPTTTLER